MIHPLYNGWRKEYILQNKDRWFLLPSIRKIEGRTIDDGWQKVTMAVRDAGDDGSQYMFSSLNFKRMSRDAHLHTQPTVAVVGLATHHSPISSKRTEATLLERQSNNFGLCRGRLGEIIACVNGLR